tara:strand:+ start:868 stop:1629 length:762 start_codon:yes stop_codon:yes gene_type:complete
MYSFSGSKGLLEDKNPIVFIHGTGMDHTVWTLPVRHFLRKKRGVLSIDLPGHGKSEGPLLSSVKDFADSINQYLDKRNIENFSVVGHSLGSLIALELSSLMSKRVNSLVLIGTAFPMMVSDQLLQLAKENKEEAIDILTYFGYSNNSRIGSNSNPGIWMTGSTKKLMLKSKENVIYNDLLACANYEDGLNSAKNILAKTTLILGGEDKLTPSKFTEDLIKKLKSPDIHTINSSGHSLMMEQPNEVLEILISSL